MKKTLRCVAVLLVLAMLLAVPVQAAGASTYASRYFTQYGTYIYVVEGNHLQIWFDMAGTKIMQKIGVSEIVIKRSTDNQNWTNVYWYYPEDYDSMMATNEGDHAGYVPFFGTHGYYYKAYVTFYAKDSAGVGTICDYTQSVYIPPEN